MTTRPATPSVAEHDDAASADSAVSWHQEQTCEHTQTADDHAAAGRWLLADHHRRVADWHRDCAMALA